VFLQELFCQDDGSGGKEPDVEEFFRVGINGGIQLNETEFGRIEPPSGSIEFGDAKTTGDALYIPGTLYLERTS